MDHVAMPNFRTSRQHAQLMIDLDLAPKKPESAHFETSCDRDASGIRRPSVRGKFLNVGHKKFFARGVTYGTFRPDASGNEFQQPGSVARDFMVMAANGINALRTYTVPPRWMLDLAYANGLYVMIGLPWEQHITFLDDRKRAREIEKRIAAEVRSCAGHPAVLCYAIGNEIPASIVRWHGRHRIESYLKQLFLAAKAQDGDGLVTYVNYPSTEYLQLPFLDFLSFNVYLESQERLEKYLVRLQNIAGDQPLLMAEIGLDSRRNGADTQARVLDWQVRTAFAAGCAGAFVFAWTDEWHRGGFDIHDWDFGLVDRQRRAKPALAAVRDAFAEAPFPPNLKWPRISVVVCSYNGSRTIRECCEALQQLHYSDYEVIIVNDGSTDSTAEIAGDFDVRLISTENMGLSHARNLGLRAATGEIVAYLDDDAFPDPHWLTYLAATFMKTRYVAVGGPNVTIQEDGWIAECIGHAPGNPTHILLSDDEAEHIPGCNMAFRREALQAIGGFDPQFRIAGDDVDVCWRLQQAGGTLGFSPSAMVWHHRRNSVRAFWRQQVNYGKAEALLELKWPEKYNRLGHHNWRGRIYGAGSTHSRLFNRGRIYYGVWGSGLFQSIYQPAPKTWRALLLMPEWALASAALALLSLLGIIWPPMLLALPLLIGVGSLSLIEASLSAAKAPIPVASRALSDRLSRRCLIAFLHLLQPLARLYGRLRHGLVPWRRQGRAAVAFPRKRMPAIWSEQWRAPEDRLTSLSDLLREQGLAVKAGGEFDRWDLEVRGGLLGMARMRMAVEEHGGGKQLLRFLVWPKFPAEALGLAIIFFLLAAAAAIDQPWPAALILGGISGLIVYRTIGDCAVAASSCLKTLEKVCDMEKTTLVKHRTNGCQDAH